MTNFVAFDIEIATEIPEGTTDWGTLHPLGISCAATWASGEDKPRVWCGLDSSTMGIGPKMTDAHLSKLIDTLFEYVENGYKIVTVNGAGFDFRELAESSGRRVACQELALGHVDCFFDVFCRLGYSPGLDAMSKGMGLSGKMQDVDGALAPELWAQGEYGKVLSYVAQDAKQTLDMALAVEAAGALRWIARSGKPNVLKIDHWLTVAEALDLPLPDTSWMKEPWPRDKFTSWI